MFQVGSLLIIENLGVKDNLTLDCPRGMYNSALKKYGAPATASSDEREGFLNNDIGDDDEEIDFEYESEVDTPGGELVEDGFWDTEGEGEDVDVGGQEGFDDVAVAPEAVRDNIVVGCSVKVKHSHQGHDTWWFGSVVCINDTSFQGPIIVDCGEQHGNVRCFPKDEIVFDQTGEAWRLHGVGRASLDLFGSVLDAVIMFDEIKAVVFRADDEIGFAIAIEIANSGTASVASDVALRKVADLLQDYLVILSIFAVAPRRRVLRGC